MKIAIIIALFCASCATIPTEKTKIISVRYLEEKHDNKKIVMDPTDTITPFLEPEY